MKEFFKEHIDELILKYAKGEISQDESDELLQWVKSEDNSSYFREQLFLLKSSGTSISVDADQAYDDLKKRLVTNKPLIKSWHYAAAAIIILLMSISAYFFFIYQSEEIYTEYIASDENMELILDDNSEVCVRKGSLISISDRFNEKNCNVILKGQAFFKVTKKENCQFVVKTGNVSTKVVGTAFDLKYDTVSGEVRISLEEGRVDVYSNDSLISRMNANEQLCINQDGNILAIREMKSKNYKAYKTHLLEFEQSPLNEVIADLTDYYGFPFIIANTKLENCMLTSRMDSVSISEVKFILEKALDTKIISLEDKIVIHGEGCSK